MIKAERRSSQTPVAARPTSLPRPGNAEFTERQARALDAARREGLDGLIVWGRGSTNSDGCQDLLYLANHMSAVSHIPDSEAHRARGHAALVLAHGRDPVLVTDSYDIDRAEVPVSDVRLSTFVDRDAARVATELGLRGGRVGLAGQTGLLHSAATCIATELGGSTVLVPADHILTALRLFKSAHEVALLREASRIGCDWMEVMLEASQPGRTEGEIVGDGLRFLAASGGWAYDVAVASGPVAHRYRHRQALPTWDSTRRLQPGDMLHFDLWGPVAHGYYCDLTRSTVVGARATAAQERVLEDSIAIVESVIAEIEPGRRLADLHAAGAQAMARRGGGASGFSAMIPFFGHSLGLDCESPFITSSAQEIIGPGMVLAIECFLGGEAGEGAGFEHVVHIGETGIEIITSAAAERPWARG
ncbi:aminopeptidase P family protein [Starkeya sp. ORNL1]|uniref:M24 family metallopeptidase n=1 Tax=Starkeya sp. ORNL1 TaxID=2709380 RepID=UPI0014629166|nr:M24 family metallopeptidase [Starkeya sp. ORNL1]QJP14809.1 aminopeptidase P family protein [Starkeya sp. ORNL1]